MPEERLVEMGARLREAREARGVSLRQLAEATKISVRHFESLERGRVGYLPAGIYRRAIVRAYAEAAALDPDDTLREFLAEQPDDLPAPGGGPVVLEPPEPVARWRWRVAANIAGLLVPIVAGVMYFAFIGGASARHDAVELLPPRVQDEWRPDIVPAGGYAEAPPPAARPVSMVVSVTSRCLVQATVDGRELPARRLEAGEQMQVHFSHDVHLVGDNAGAVQFSINGRAGRMPGEPGQPLDLRVTRDTYQSFLVSH